MLGAKASHELGCMRLGKCGAIDGDLIQMNCFELLRPEDVNVFRPAQRVVNGSRGAAIMVARGNENLCAAAAEKPDQQLRRFPIDLV